MEITEECLQRVFDEIEECAIKNGKKVVEYETIVSIAWSMRTKLLAILRSKSEEDLVSAKMVNDDFMEILEKSETGFIKLPVVHFKNVRTCKTLCGKSYDIPKRKVTRSLNRVTCRGCLHNVKNLKWIKDMIEYRNRTSKSP